MFRTACKYLKHTLTSTLYVTTTTSSAASAVNFFSTTPSATPFGWSQKLLGAYYCSSAVGGGGDERRNEDEISYAEAKRLLRLVNVDELKKKLGMENKEVIDYSDLLGACEKMGLAKSAAEASDFARILDEAGVVLLFRDKVYLNPDKVVDVVRKVAPFALLLENDPTKAELNKLEEEMKEINMVAYKQVRGILWTGLALSVMQVGLFFRLTFWEFSWDVMEPIAFFTTASGIVVGYAYFLYTSRDPTYQDFMKRLFLSRRRKVMKKRNFDIGRFEELQKKCELRHSSTAFVKREMGIEVKPEDLNHGHSQS